MDYEMPIGNETIEDLIDYYNHNHDIFFIYNGKEYCLCCEKEEDFIQDGLKDANILYRCECGKAMTDIIIDGMPLQEVLQKSYIDSIY